MKCWRNACNLGRNSSSLTPSRKENTPLKLTNEISCICSPVVFLRMRILPKYGFGRNHDDPSSLLPVNPQVRTSLAFRPTFDCVRAEFVSEDRSISALVSG